MGEATKNLQDFWSRGSSLQNYLLRDLFLSDFLRGLSLWDYLRDGSGEAITSCTGPAPCKSERFLFIRAAPASDPIFPHHLSFLDYLRGGSGERINPYGQIRHSIDSETF